MEEPPRPRPEPAVLRRRRIALACIAVAALAAGIALGADGGSEPGGTAEPAAAAPTCPAEVASDPRRLVGQMLIVRMEATATEGLLARLRAGELGGVILFPPEGTSPSALREQIALLRRAAARGAAAAPLIAIDQEGGEVRRLPDLPPDRAPRALAAFGERAAHTEGAATGRALHRLGIDVDLAPVLDVPAVDGAFIASRAFSADPSQAAALGVAFGGGLQDEGVGATAKHFPGLGLATENTDLGPSVIQAPDAALDSGLEPFRAAVDAGFDLVMVSNATYPALDPRPASQSRRVIDGLLREQLGFDGAVITDDLGAGALTGAGIDEGDAAVGAARAGSDLLLFALSDGGAAREALVGALRRGELDRASLVASCARTTSLRAELSATSP